MTDNWLAKDYTVPENNSNGKYYKFSDGDNTFRILGKPIMGHEYWVDADGKMREKGSKPGKGDKPVRLRMDAVVTGEMVESGLKHFWGMIVWDYTTNSPKVLQITQKGIQKAIAALARNAKWGSPTAYDITVTRSGEGLETEYSVLPQPKEELPKEVKENAEMAVRTITLEALFDGGDPFGPQKTEAPRTEEINLDDLPPF